MIAHPHLHLIAVGLVMIGWGARVYAEDDVTIYHVPLSSSATAGAATSADGTPVVHKSLHKHKSKTSLADQNGAEKDASSPAPAAKKKTSAVAATKRKSVAPSITMSASPSTPAVAPAVLPTLSPALAPSSTPIIVTKSASGGGSHITIAPAPIGVPPAGSHPGAGPEVETGLPVARHDSNGNTMTVNASASIPDGATVHGKYQTAANFPLSALGPIGSSAGSYLPGHDAVNNFTFTNFDRRTKNTYPWKMNIITTMFWIGEGDTPISSTDNVSSAWDEDWRSNNGGTDTPNDRSGYASGRHAAMINPFYVALPFNDLAFPDKARRWLPAGWYRPPRNGKQVSACKDRWVEIKNAQGDVCYAQWEDVGPLRYDHAEYVFGDERPETYTRAGLDVSPAVAKYLNINATNRITRWRFVDDVDVPPGYWLKYDEEALLFRAMKSDKEMQKIDALRAPIDDQTDMDSNKKKVGAAKG